MTDMKNNILAAAVLITALIASCTEEQTGAGDATISFDKTEYTYKESAGLVKIPVIFTGEPEKYPITFDIDVTAEDGRNPENVIIMTQSKGLRFMGDQTVPVYVEFKVIDNQEINEDVNLTFTITGINGATPLNCTADVTITDNDNNPYDRLWGEWIFKGYDADGEENSFLVTICGGWSEEEIEQNAEKLLVCWGWGGQQHDFSGEDITPDHQPVWYMDYDAEEGAVAVQANTLMATSWNFSAVSDEYCDLYLLTVMPDWTLSENTKLKGYWNEDMTIITFEGTYGLAARVIGIETQTNYGYWYGFTDITLTRKPTI